MVELHAAIESTAATSASRTQAAGGRQVNRKARCGSITRQRRAEKTVVTGRRGGVQRGNSGTISTNFLRDNFGKYDNSESSLYLMSRRPYSPDIGRFPTPDPIGVSGGTNLYQYAGNNPTNEIDPSGTEHFVVGESEKTKLKKTLDEKGVRYRFEELEKSLLYTQSESVLPTGKAKIYLVVINPHDLKKLTGLPAGTEGLVSWNYHTISDGSGPRRIYFSQGDAYRRAVEDAAKTPKANNEPYLLDLSVNKRRNIVLPITSTKAMRWRNWRRQENYFLRMRAVPRKLSRRQAKGPRRRPSSSWRPIRGRRQRHSNDSNSAGRSSPRLAVSPIQPLSLSVTCSGRPRNKSWRPLASWAWNLPR